LRPCDRSEFFDVIEENLLELRLLGKRRVAFFGWDRNLTLWLLSKGLLEGMDTTFYLAEPGTDYPGVAPERCRPQSELGNDAPDLVIIPRYHAIRIYEFLVEHFGIEPRKILMDPANWRNRDYTADPEVWNLYMGVPGSIRGGLSSFEVCAHLWDGLKYVFDRNIPGDLVNLGVYQGWSIYFMALIRDHFHQQHRKIVAFDTFSGWSQPSHPLDQFAPGAGRFVPGHTLHKDTCLALVEENVSGFPNIELLQGDVRTTLGTFKCESVALALFDMDDYTPTQATLGPMYERLAPGGVFLHDHYSYASLGTYCTWGQRRAMQEFLAAHPMFNLTGTNLFLKF
jgi:hypothetical protein